MRHLIPILLACALSQAAQAQHPATLPPAPAPVETQPLARFEPADLTAPAVIMAFTTIIAGGLLTGGGTSGEDLAIPIVATGGVFSAGVISLKIGDRRKKEKLRRQALTGTASD